MSLVSSDVGATRAGVRVIRWHRLAVALCATTIACVSPAATAAADHTMPIGGGLGVAMLHGVPLAEATFAYFCTLAAVGYDAADNLIGITNAHCVYDRSGNQWPGDEVVLESAFSDPEADVDNAEVVGTVAHISGGNPLVPGPNGSGLDYAVIVFDKSKVHPTATVGATTINHIAPPPPPGTPLCKLGITTGWSCGVLLGTLGPYIMDTITESSGDSGAPILVGDTVIGIQWVTGGATAMTAILDDLNRRGGPGAGFRLAS